MKRVYIETELRRLGDTDLASAIAGVREDFNLRHPGVGDIAFGNQAPSQDQVLPEVSSKTSGVDQAAVDQRTLQEAVDKLNESIRWAYMNRRDKSSLKW